MCGGCGWGRSGRNGFLLCVESVVADRIEVAVSRLLGAAAACVILLSFAAGSRK